MSDILHILISFILALGISLYAVPSVIRIVTALKLFDKPNERSSAISPVPTLGGIAIFISFIFSSTVLLKGHDTPELVYIHTALMIMFFIGFKDDILELPPWKKLVAELISAALIIFMADIRFTNLHGFLGIKQINFLSSVLLTAFVIIVFINSINLMDGIDGLASGLTILFSVIFGGWFFLSGHLEYAILSFTLTGATVGFFRYNVYGTKNKIFMGDTGSLVIGTIIAVIAIKFNEFNIDQNQSYAIASAPAVSFGILIYPLADTIRVFIIRISQKRSPFSPDKNHLHHRLLLLGFTHKKATYTIIVVNGAFIIPVLFLHHIGIGWLMVFILFSAGVLFMIPGLSIQKRKLIDANDPNQHLLLPGNDK